MKIVECVPNVSEGKNRRIIDELGRVVSQVSGVRLLDIDPGDETNRTVYTFVGEPEAVAEAAFLFTARAAELIDMRTHHGAHARMGAVDVCPLVPVAEISMEECVRLAQALGARVGRELHIPVYLYEAAASRPERRNLAEIRKGEYEGLSQKLGDPAFAPDFGPSEFGERQQRSGASVIGARPFLVAFNVNLNTRDKKLANEIAFALRDSGRAKKDAAGKPLRDAAGQTVMIPGRLRAVKATGWVIEAYGCAQVSMNLCDLSLTSLHAAFEACCEEAARIGVRVTGSELVGLAPKAALVDAGRHFLRKMNKPDFAPERELIHVAHKTLGLSELVPFDAKKKVIEYQIGEPKPLAEMSVEAFVDVLSSDAPAPGGGSAAALAGASSAALVAMVAAISAPRNGALGEIGVQAQALKQSLLDAVDKDTQAFDRVLAAMRLPRATSAQAEQRVAALEAANRAATQVPLGVLRLAAEAAELSLQATKEGHAPSVSDAGAAAVLAQAAAAAARYNVLINLRELADRSFAEATRQEADLLLARAERACTGAAALVESVILAG